MIDFEHVTKVYETQNDENVALEDIQSAISTTASLSLCWAIPVPVNPPSSS